ncbi:MAG: hypothetical protein SFU25_08450 [Candidatus Caenarcaniphilales bacterium]|nr:hypothetical protein [Candidatus Caenarcaniphilales bacterium]
MLNSWGLAIDSRSGQLAITNGSLDPKGKKPDYIDTAIKAGFRTALLK